MHYLFPWLHEMLNAFSYFPGTLDIPFILQWQRTLAIFNGIIVSVNTIWFLLDLAQEDQDLTDTIIGSVSMAFIVAGLVKTYIKEFVNIDKI